MQIALFNVHYSENLGDGLLSLCLSREMAKSHPDVTVTTYDLAGRTGFGEGSKRRSLGLSVLERSPRALRKFVMRMTLGTMVRRSLRPIWAQALSEADCAVMGGGNLLSDTDLNFPLKIAGLGAEIGRSQKPWAIYGVGANDNWSSEGRRLFESAFLDSPPVHVAVRDERSKKIWDTALIAKGAREARVCSDPAMLACDHFPAAVPRKAGPPVLGLNITAPKEVSLHSEGSSMPLQHMTSWWVDLVLRAIKAGYEVRLFTNGRELDDQYLRLLYGERLKPSHSDRKLCLVPRPLRPDTLADIISGCDVIAGHRMHAHIPAFSYQIPSVGFSWDTKLHSFFESVGRADFMLEPEKCTPLEAWKRIMLAHSTGVRRETWVAATALARRNIADLVSSVDSAAVHSEVRAEAI